MSSEPVPVTKSLEFILSSGDFVEIQHGPDFHIDLRYASDNNVVGRNVYGPFNRAFLHKIAAEKLHTALEKLKSEQPQYRFIIYDALRPRSIQRVLWDHVKGTPGESYFANPDVGSLHSFGFAIDISLLDEKGHELDMGAGFDDFRPVSHPRLEAQFLADGTLTRRHIQNRDLLRLVMGAGGFIQLPHEWWHFDALPKAEVRGRFQIVE